MGRCRRGPGCFRSSAAAALMGAVTLLVAPGALAQTVTVEPSPPVPMAPMEVTFSGENCGPFETIELRLERSNPFQDFVLPNPRYAVTVQADSSGAFVGSITTTAYPGHWIASGGCGLELQTFGVPDIPGFAMSASPVSVAAGSTVSVTISGSACPGQSVYWSVGRHPGPVTDGTVAVRDDGSWSVTAPVTVRSTDPLLPVGASCGLEGGI